MTDLVGIGVLDLICPRCHVELLADSILVEIICDKCGFEFPVLEGL